MEVDDLDRRIQTLIDTEVEMSNRVVHWFYLSYADKDKFRGGVYLQAYGPVTAGIRANQIGASPGGQVVVVKIPEHELVKLPPEEGRNRLLSLEELNTYSGGDMRSIAELEAEHKNEK